MRLYTYRMQPDGRDQIGIGLEPGSLYALEDFGMQFADMNDVICRITPEQMDKLRTIPHDAVSIPLDRVCCRAPIPHPMQDVVCLGINYDAHHKEAGRFNKEAFGDRPKAIYFSKRVNEANWDGGVIPLYADLVDSLDYEVELGVILGKDAWNVPVERAQEYIFGYTIINDVSARNLQTGHKQWYFGKSLDGYTPMGPCIVTADEIAYPPALGIRCSVNGELRQNGSTGDLITTISEIIAELSRGMMLKAGTIIATGTPAGVGMGMQPPCFLKAGDVVTCEIDGIGTLTNAVGDQ
nr:fumarylacetoacetate hydrolase family protein [uncultured Agathobaculum sp.]